MLSALVFKDENPPYKRLFGKPVTASSIREGFFWIALFVICRLILLVFLHPYYYLAFSEELVRGTIAKEMISGLSAPFFAYRADEYAGGSLVMAGVISLFFRLFGSILFALKLAGLSFYAAALTLWYCLLSRWTNQWTSRFFCILYIFSPPAFTAYSTCAMGFHSESIVFSALSLYLFMEIVCGRRRSLFLYFLFGFVAGFGLWFQYIYGVTLAALGLFGIAYTRGRVSIKAVNAMMIGFLVGFSPWLWTHFHLRFDSFTFQGAPVYFHFAWGHLLRPAIHPAQFVGYWFFLLFSPEDWGSWLRWWINLPYAILFGTLVSLFLWNRRNLSIRPNEKDPQAILEVVSVLMVGVLLMTIQISDLKQLRYFAPTFTPLFFFAASALSAIRVHRQKAVRLAAMIIVTILVGLHMVFAGLTMSVQYAGQIWHTKGYSYASLPEPLCATTDSCLDFYKTTAPHLNAEDAYALSTYVAMETAPSLPESRWQAALRGRVCSYPSFFMRQLYFQFGEDVSDADSLEIVLRQLDFLRKASVEAYGYAWLGIYSNGELLWPPDFYTAVLNRPSDTLNPAWIRSVYWHARGWSFAKRQYDRDHSLYRLIPNLAQEVKRIPQTHRPAFFNGVGDLLYYVWYPNPLFPTIRLNLIQQFPRQDQLELARGAGMAARLNGIEGLLLDDTWEWQMFADALNSSNRVAFNQGMRDMDALFFRS